MSTIRTEASTIEADDNYKFQYSMSTIRTQLELGLDRNA